MAIALEYGVMNKDMVKSVYSWYKLVKLWGALRSHDTEAIPPASIKFDRTDGLEAQIMRTKTGVRTKDRNCAPVHFCARMAGVP